MKEQLRHVRDLVYAAATKSKKSVDVEGVTLAFGDASPRMRYVMTRGYERGDALLASAILSPSDYVLEAGSAIGFMAIYCLKVIGVRGVMLVEANPTLPRQMRENFRLNGLDEPNIVQAAVSAEDGTLSFGVNKNFWSSSIVQRNNETRIEVRARSLPSLAADMPEKPTALVMDIEGAEADIPLDHFGMFSKLVIETHPKLVGKERIDKLLSSLSGIGFAEVAKEGGSYAFMRQP